MALNDFLFLIARNSHECQRIFVTLDKPESVDTFLRNQSFTLNGQSVRVTRNIPKNQPLYDRSTTGLKVSISESNGSIHAVKKLREDRLTRYLEGFGSKIETWQWMNDTQTEALVEFAQ